MIPKGNKLPEYGLTPPGVTADWSAYGYYFCLAGYFYDGLQSATKALSEIGYEDVRRLQEHVKDFHGEILRAYEWAQTRMPVNQLQNGTWVLPYPSQVPFPGTMGLFFPGEDDNRPALGCFDVELGASNMVPLGVLDPNSPDVRWMVDHLEDFWFLSEGWHDFPAAVSEKDWFNLGGFSKVQPNLCRVPEIYATLDEIKPFIRSLLQFHRTPDQQAESHLLGGFHPGHRRLGEHRRQRIFPPSDTLHVAHGTRRGTLVGTACHRSMAQEWYDGSSVRDAPTHFGSMSYRIMSFADHGYIEAEIDSPTRSSPKEIVIRLRHPQGRRIRAVTVDGVPLYRV